MLKMPIHQEAVEHPIPCSECGEHADVLFFEKLTPTEPGITLALKKVYAKCFDHLLMAEYELPGVE